MRIQDWENYIIQKYKAQKIINFLDLKKYLTNPENYSFDFTPNIITETEIPNTEFYAAYVFDENIIGNRIVKSTINSGWNTTIVFIGSKDNVNITKIFMHDSNGLTNEELDNFYLDINPLISTKEI